jgi:cell division protein ZapA
MEASAREAVQVSIFNRVYSLRSGGGRDYVMRVARAVDERMRLISEHIVTHDVAKIAILAALQFADELERLREQRAAVGPATAEGPASVAGEARNNAEAEGATSWFEDIFDGIGAAERGERLSDGVSAKLRTLRQTEPEKDGFGAKEQQ